MTFFDAWQTAVSEKNTLLCAGLDLPLSPADGETGLPSQDQRLDWALRFIEAVAPYVAAVKPNLKYWLYDAAFPKILACIKSKQLLLILDSKIADIGSTNAAEYLTQSRHGVDAVTVSPLAGNVSQTVADCIQQSVDCFVMGLMSNPEYAVMKQALIPLSQTAAQTYDASDLVELGGQNYVRLYQYLTREAVAAGAVGIVTGTTGHITVEELANVRKYAHANTLYLCPGIGAQGGDPRLPASVLPVRNLILNVGRALMFPDGFQSSPKDQAEAAKYYRDAFRELL